MYFTHTATSAGTKRKQCGDCEGCQATNCGECTNCLDKKIFGGPGIKKQCCKRCRCLTFLTPLQVLNYNVLITLILYLKCSNYHNRLCTAVKMSSQK